MQNTKRSKDTVDTWRAQAAWCSREHSGSLATWKPALRVMSTALSTMLFSGTTLVPRAPPEAVMITFALRQLTTATSVYVLQHCTRIRWRIMC